MQHKRAHSLRKALIGTAAVALVALIALLMTTTVPAPSKPVEKELDAKAFLESK